MNRLRGFSRPLHLEHEPDGVMIQSRHIYEMKARARAMVGFTLLELLITLAIIVVLGMIAVTSYSKYTVRANRVEAKAALTGIAQRLERRFTSRHSYLVDAAEKTALLGNPAETDGGRYTLELAATETTYTITANAKQGKGQFERDQQCRSFSLDHTGKELATSADGKDTTTTCWGR